MSTVQEIETAIEELSAQEKTALSAWFQEHLAHEFDAKLARGIDAGVFDSLVEEAVAEHHAAKSRPLPGA